MEPCRAPSNLIRFAGALLPGTVVFALALPLWLSWAWASPGQDSAETAAADKAAHVRVRWMAENLELVPGTTQRLAVHFSIDPGWHLYSPYRSDTGLPIEFRVSAPPGFTVDAPIWPAPKRLISAGSILDHVYENEATAIVPLEIPADARPGDAVAIRAHVDWLVCSYGCFPGQQDIVAHFPIAMRGAAADPSPDAAPIRAAFDRAPLPQDRLAANATRAWTEDAWQVRIPGAIALEFYPDSTCVPLLDPISNAAASGDRLRLRLGSDPPADARMSGLLAVTTGSGSRCYRIDSPRPLSGMDQPSVQTGSPANVR